MPVAIAGLRALPPDQPLTEVSPMVELGSALHVPHGPVHHRADAWAADTRFRLVAPGGVAAEHAEYADTMHAFLDFPGVSRRPATPST